MRASEVFTPNKLPEVTFIVRGNAAAIAGAHPTSSDNGKGAILDHGKPFQNRLLAGRVAREQGGNVMTHPSGGCHG